MAEYPVYIEYLVEYPASYFFYFCEHSLGYKLFAGWRGGGLGASNPHPTSAVRGFAPSCILLRFGENTSQRWERGIWSKCTIYIYPWCSFVILDYHCLSGFAPSRIYLRWGENISQRWEGVYDRNTKYIYTPGVLFYTKLSLLIRVGARTIGAWASPSARTWCPSSWTDTT